MMIHFPDSLQTRTAFYVLGGRKEAILCAQNILGFDRKRVPGPAHPFPNTHIHYSIVFTVVT